MIKKEYMTPEMEAIDVQLQSLICESDPNIADTDHPVPADPDEEF